MTKKFYLTTAIPYVNAAPHIGHALEFVLADVINRYHRLIEDNVLFLSGSDENALKNVRAAEKAHIPIQKFIDTNAGLFKDLALKLNIHFDIFQKGSDQKNHYPSSQKLWQLCQKNGDIYKKPYEGLYCVGCEQFYNSEELNEKGECLEHPGKKLEIIKEENYFFRLSKYQKPIIELIKSKTLEITPEKRRQEVLSFLKDELKDISISRTNERAKHWGVPVPNDPTQRIYVWFDALNIYQSGVGFGSNEETYQKWWPADVHVIGKGIIRFHAIYWPAFLLSAGLKIPKSIFVHEYFMVNGQKMSKSIGNIIDPLSLIEKYQNYGGADSLRYYFLAKFSPFNDADFSEEKFKNVYNADLANGLGNLVSRIAKLCQLKNFDNRTQKPDKINYLSKQNHYHYYLSTYQFNLALEEIWRLIKDLNALVDSQKVWELPVQEAQSVLSDLVTGIRDIAIALIPFLPETAEKIENQFGQTKITPLPPLFLRIK